MKLRYLLLPLSLLLGGYLLQSPQGQNLLRQAEIPNPLATSTRHSFYKWRDAGGQWHYSDRAPAGQPVLVVEVDTAFNILPAPGSLLLHKSGTQPPQQQAPDLLERLGGFGDFTSPAEARQLAEGHMQRTRQMIGQN